MNASFYLKRKEGIDMKLLIITLMFTACSTNYPMHNPPYDSPVPSPSQTGQCHKHSCEKR